MAEKQIPKTLGRYQITRELGKGAMGVVYEGRDPIIGRRVAIKTARRDVMEASGRAEEMMARFLREAAAAGSLNHPNIITIYDADEQDGMAFIAMEFIESGTLQDFMGSKKRLGPDRVAEIGAAICTALAAAHDNGIVHRDIKPANIMMLADGTIKVADFGIAHVSDSNLTQEGAMIGTPHFMSPEQFMGQKVDGRSDLFSVGVILYEMLTGEKPFAGEVLSTVMHRVIKVDPIEPKELNFSVGDCLSKVVMKALGKNPNQRYQNGRAMTAALLESVKPDPDPAITGIAASVSAEATTLTLKAGEATVVSAQLPDTGATVPGTVQAPAATPAAAPASAPAQPAPAAPPAAAPAPAPVPAPAPKPEVAVPLAKPGGSMVRLAVGGVALALMVGAILFMVFGRGGGAPSKPPATPTAPAAATPAAPPAPAAPAANEPAIAKLSVTVFLADSLDVYSAAKDGHFEQCDPNGTATIVVADPKTGAEIQRAADVNAKVLTLATPLPRVKITAEKDGYVAFQLEYLAKEPNETKRIDVLLRKK